MEYLTLVRKPVSVITVLLASLFVAFFRDVIDNLGFPKRHVLIIGILSSPENFESRSSIRETWLNLTSELSLDYHFVVGKHLCSVHPFDRVSPYTCQENQLTVPENVTTETEFSVLSPRKDGKKKSTYQGKINAIGFGFQTLAAITVKKLGVISKVLRHVNDVRVKLRLSNTTETLASVTISRDLTADECDIIMKQIPTLLLEPNMEVQVVVEFTSDMSSLPGCDPFQWSSAPGVINYLQLIQFGDRKPWAFSPESCSYATMNYTITDVNRLKKDLRGKEERRIYWRKTMGDISRRLKNENDIHGDIFFVDVVDVYRNLPEKLLYFFRKLADTELFYYVLKTDDDSFIDVERVYRHLLVLSQHGLSTGKLWWWSKYRELWKVQEAGKWREDEFRSACYPSFPCGGGYVLSKEIVNYLSREVNLRLFQGEDVSVGIWLSGLKTVQHRSSVTVRHHGIQQRIVEKYGGSGAWLRYINSGERKLTPDICEWSCDNDKILDVPLCNRVQLTPIGMREIWEKYIRQGFV